MPRPTFVSHPALPNALCIVVALAYCAPAHAADRDCTGYGSLKDKPRVEAGKVVGDDKKINFIKSGMDDKSCPAAGAACRRKGFLVPGNAVLVSGTTGDFTCAVFVNGKGVETDGWMPKAAIAVDSPGTGPGAKDWAGTWVREEAKVTIKVDGKDALAIHGDATFGSEDPDRVKRGDVNMGEIAAKVSPSGDALSFAMGDNDKTMPVDKGDDSVCKVWMRRVGAYLLVDDDNACGGMNVSFRGTYVLR